MIARLVTILFCYLLALSCLQADDFADANHQFESADYKGAAAAYEKIIDREGPGAAVLYNLGNSYQSEKHYGPAILAYERARLLAPRDPDLLANLALARKAAAAFEETIPNPRLQTILEYLSPNEWSWLAASSALFLGLLAVAAGAVKLTRRPRRLAVISAGLAGFALVTAGTALYLRRGESSRGIVLSDNATVRLSPFEKAESLGTAGPGRIVRLGAVTDGFRYVEVPGTNLRGWLAKAEVAPVIPGR